MAGEPTAFSSTDGRTFVASTLPGGLSSDGIDLAAGPAGFTLAATNGQPAILQSSDGRTWHALPLPPLGQSYVSAMGYADGQLSVIAASQSTSTAFTFLGGQWTGTDLSAIAGHPMNGDQATFGPLGVAVVAAPSTAAQTWDVLYSPNGTSWSSTSLTPLAGPITEVTNVWVGAASIVVTANKPITGGAVRPAPQVNVIGTAITPSR